MLSHMAQKTPMDSWWPIGDAHQFQQETQIDSRNKNLCRKCTCSIKTNLQTWMEFNQLLLATKFFEHQTWKVELTKQDWLALYMTVNISHPKLQDTWQWQHVHRYWPIPLKLRCRPLVHQQLQARAQQESCPHSNKYYNILSTLMELHNNDTPIGQPTNLQADAVDSPPSSLRKITTTTQQTSISPAKKWSKQFIGGTDFTSAKEIIQLEQTKEALPLKANDEESMQDWDFQAQYQNISTSMNL